VLNKEKHLKGRFLEAIVKGELGSFEERGAVVTLQEFKLYFNEIKTQYVSSFMPAATFEPGQSTPTRTKFLFRVKKGVYRVHGEVLAEKVRLMEEERLANELLEPDSGEHDSVDTEVSLSDMSSVKKADDDSSVNEAGVSYRV